MLESALVSVALFSLIFAIFEFSLIFRDYITVQDTADLAAAEAASYGSSVYGENEVTADYVALATVRNATGVIGEGVERVIVWKAAPTGPLSRPPADCLSSTEPFHIGTMEHEGKQLDVLCNIYNTNGLYDVQEGNFYAFNCQESEVDPGNSSCGWPPLSRQNRIGEPNIDYIGVYVQTKRNLITNVLPDGITLSGYSVKRLEVERSESQQVQEG